MLDAISQGGQNGVAWRSRDGHSAVHKADVFQLADALPAESFDCIWTDPPYFLSNGGTTCVAGRRVSVDKGQWDRSQGRAIDHEFNLRWLAACYRLLKPAGTIWVSGTAHVYFSVGMALMDIGYRLLNDVVWEKPNPPPNLGRRCFTHATEILLWATKAQKGQKPAYTFNYDAMRLQNGGRQMKNVWRLMAAGPKEKNFGKHPTQKPLALIQRCLEASTHPGDSVFDPFAGSGSTGVAALLLGRRFTGCEIQPSFVDLAVKRLRDAETRLVLVPEQESA
jgi:site-specific DNA-methyltransferase (adenine-specific)